MPRRRRFLLAALVPTLVCVTLTVFPPPLLTDLTSSVYDRLLRTGTRPPGGEIVIVDVDERSLREIGQWPWDRSVMAQLVDRLRTMGARAIALDIIFSEPDRAPSGGDAALAATLRGARVVVGYALTFDGAEGPSATPMAEDRACVLHPFRVATVVAPGATADASVFRASDAICSLPAFAEAAGASGFLNAAPDSDGVLRRVPLLIELNGELYPGLALATVVVATGSRPAQWQVANANTTALAMTDRHIPLDGRGNLLLRYRGPSRTFPHFSATDVIAGRVEADTVRDRIVFVGATALGMQDLVSTPHDRLFSGVEVQATIADGLLQGDFLRRPEHALVIELLLVLTLCLLVAGVVVHTRIRWGAAVAAASVALLAAVMAWLVRDVGIVLSPVLPVAGAALALVTAVVVTLAADRRAALAGIQGARRETERATHVKDEFLMTVSHELRTPLTAIYGYAQMLAKGALQDDQKRRAIATIERNARAQTQLIDDLLDASQVLAGRLRLDVAGVDLAAVVRAVADSLGPALEAKRIGLTVEVSALDPIPGDPDRLRQVVWNLLSNAIKFTPEGGRVDVRLERSGAHALLTVRDTGIGIAPEFLPMMFERFRQEDMGTRRQFGGLGVGLALVRYIVELHGGTVRASSEGPGRGAVLAVRLPLKGAAGEVSLANAVRAGDVRLDGVRVLIVDDQVETRTLAGATLLNAGARAVTAATPTDALAILDGSEQDVLLVSLDMPDDGGYLVAHEARLRQGDAGAFERGQGDDGQAAVPIIAMCANAASHDGRPDREKFALRLVKPLDPVQLVTVIAALTHHGIRAADTQGT